MDTSTVHPMQNIQNWKRDFFTIWTGQALSLLGSSLSGFALIWWLTATTGSATILAGATLMMILPQFLVSPIAGALVDRWSRRSVIMVADSLIALFSLGLALLFWMGKAQFWQVYLVILVRAVGNAFHTPAMQASTPLMVPEEHLTRVAGINQTFQGVMNMIAPPLGALLLGLLPIASVLMIDVTTALLAVLPLFFILIPDPSKSLATAGKAANQKSSVGGDIRAGLRFVWGWPGLLIIMLTASGLNFLNVPAMSFTPLLVTQRFQLGVLELGWMQAAFGMGIISGGLFLSIWSGYQRRIQAILVSVIAMGLGLLLMGLAPVNAFPLALAGNLLGAFMSTVVSGLVFAMVQSIVPPEMLGRVFSLLLSAAAGAAPLGLVVAGPVVDALGIQFWYLLAGAVTVFAGVGIFFIPTVIQVEKKQRAALESPCAGGNQINK